MKIKQILASEESGCEKKNPEKELPDQKFVKLPSYADFRLILQAYGMLAAQYNSIMMVPECE
jgi:hypothetical protein